MKSVPTKHPRGQTRGAGRRREGGRLGRRAAAARPRGAAAEPSFGTRRLLEGFCKLL